MIFFLIIVGLILILKVFTWPFKILMKLLINGVLGVILLILVNFVGEYINLHIAINPATALIAGFLGVPGVILLIVMTMLVK